MSMFGPTMCEFNNLKAEHDETRRRLGQAERTIRFMAGDIDDDSPPQASPTLTDRLAETLRDIRNYLEVAHIEDVDLLLAEYDAARSAPAAQPHAVPADVLASIDLLEDEASAEPCNEHGRELNAAIKRVCRYVRKSASGAVAAGGGAQAAQPPTRKLNRAAFREWVKELKAGQARAAAERLTRMCKGEIEPYDYVSDAKLVNEAVIAWTEELIEPTPAASPPAGEILKQAANQIEWYRSLCQCLERGSLCQNCNDSTDIIDALRSVAPLPPLAIR